MDNYLQFTILILLLALSAFFSSAETAMTTANRIRIKTLADEGNEKAIRLLRILDQSGKMLSAILIGNNIVNLTASSLTTALTIRLFGSAAIGISTGILTLLILILGEIAPKTMAAIKADQLALAYSPFIWWLMTIMTPVIFIVDHLSRLLLRLFGTDPDAKADTITEQELRTLVETGHEEGVLEKNEHDLILNVFDFGDTVAKDIMVPRADVISVPLQARYSAIAAVFRRQKFSRIPVYSNDRDNIVGILNIKDFAFVKDHENFHAADIMYEPHFTYETKKNSELMVEMRENSIGMTVILDEYGSAVGIVTMEDLLEELVGEIRDEYDTDEKDQIRETSPGSYSIDGSLKLDDLNEALELHLSSDDYDSISGYMTEKLDHLPQVGEIVTTEDGDTLTVDRVSRRRVARVSLVRKAADPSEHETKLS